MIFFLHSILVTLTIEEAKGCTYMTDVQPVVHVQSDSSEQGPVTPGSVVQLGEKTPIFTVYSQYVWAWHN